MSEKKLLNVLYGQEYDMPPVWLMRQAGRYLPEYRELRAAKGGFLDMVYDPAAACEITLQPIRRYSMDGAILFSDILMIPQALGRSLEFVAGEGPKLNPIRTPDDMANMVYNPAQLDPIYETVSNVAAGLAGEGFEDTTLIGFCGAPWTVACYMVNGQGSKDGFQAVKAFAASYPSDFETLLEHIATASADYLIKQIEAGAEAVKIFDSWAGLTPDDRFDDFILKPTARIIELVQQTHPKTPIIGFPRGAGERSKHYAQQLKISAIAIDQSMDRRWAVDHLAPHCALQGNLDPETLIVGGVALEKEVRSILDEWRGVPYIFNLGHGIDKTTPPEHVSTLLQIIRER